MIFAIADAAIRARTKTVTRRRGWLDLMVGDRVLAVDGEQVALAELEIVDVRREPLDSITAEDLAREGFPGHTSEQFVALYCRTWGGLNNQLCTRIEFTYCDDITAIRGSRVYDYRSRAYLGLASARLYREWLEHPAPYILAKELADEWWYPAGDVLGNSCAARAVYVAVTP